MVWSATRELNPCEMLFTCVLRRSITVAQKVDSEGLAKDAFMLVSAQFRRYRDLHWEDRSL